MEEAKQSEISGELRLPESPRLPMEFLSRSWSASSFQLSKALAPSLHHNSKPPSISSSSIPEELTNITADFEYSNSNSNTTSGNASSSSSSFASSSSSNASQSQLLLDRIMSERIMSFTEISPMTSGRPSHSSGPLSGGSPLLSPSRDFDDVVKNLRESSNGGGTQQVQIPVCRGGMMSPGGGKTVGRWLKDRREKKKEEIRVQNAQLHAIVSVAGVAAAVASMAAAAAAANVGNGKDETRGKLDLAVASAATLVAAHCVEAAECMGVERDQLASVVGSAVNVRCYDDILTLTAAAATALRGATTLKARAMKDFHNGAGNPMGKETETNKRDEKSDLSICEGTLGESPISTSELEFLGTGRELLKRTRNGDLHWKIVSVYIHRSGEVMLKMKSKYVGGTITNKKKNVVLEVCKNMPSWPGRQLVEDGEHRRYFGLKTAVRGVVEFECRDQREHDLWTEGVSRLLAIVAARKNRHKV